MALPTREQMLAVVDVRFRELAPMAPLHLDPNDPKHETMIRQWHEAHHEVLSDLTNGVFFSYFPNAPDKLDPGDPSQAIFIEYWKDIANQIDTGQPGTYDWSKADAPGDSEEETPPQDGSVRLEAGIESVRILMDEYAAAVDATTLAAKVIDHTWTQVDKLRGLVSDGTFQTFDHWWRSASYSEAIYDEDDRNEQLAFVRDLTLEAKIDRTTGELDLLLAGWASDLRNDKYFGRISNADR